MICSYCGSENGQYAKACGFCDAFLKKERPKMREFVYLDQVELPFGELSQFHTYDLLILLRLVREERSKCYNLMRTVQKGSELIEIDSDTLVFSEKEYRCYTARMKVIEGILIDRMGYKPKRVDNKLLESLRVKIENG
ncbi:hypothetical protein [Metabacillus rhizolycopersici]|uniref:Zinc ribbon domain-containing protein n=1 Tax=Metabacillus rhizolycopersici TaxID=2875709 RepID=A0ABS7UYP4_9BACI|nr:hypothetical protein [Metabacillus rhizolycopersici]MBZ5753451.1 hypothetical protein [Metabacillus rhizolycopersici]